MTPDMRNTMLALTQTESIDLLWAMHCTQMARYGFDRLLHGFTRFRTANALGDPNDFVTLSNHGPSYTDTFLRDAHYHHAPMVKWALENDGWCSWSVLADMQSSDMLTADERRVMAFNLSNKVTAGYSISFR